MKAHKWGVRVGRTWIVWWDLWTRRPASEISREQRAAIAR